MSDVFVGTGGESLPALAAVRRRALAGDALAARLLARELIALALRLGHGRPAAYRLARSVLRDAPPSVARSARRAGYAEAERSRRRRGGAAT